MNDEKKAKWLRARGWVEIGVDDDDDPRFRLVTMTVFPDGDVDACDLDEAYAHQRSLDAAEERRVECDSFTRTLAACRATQTDTEDAAKTAASVARDWFRSRFGAPEGERNGDD